MVDSEKMQKILSNLQGEWQWRPMAPVGNLLVEMDDKLAFNLNKVSPKIIQFHLASSYFPSKFLIRIRLSVKGKRL